MTELARQDFAFPFRIDPVSQQTAQAGYAAHVDQMVRQLLLTAPANASTCRSSAAGCGRWCSPRLPTRWRPR